MEREAIDRIRLKFEDLPNKTPENQEIILKYRTFENVQIAILTIKSGSKNALSGRMMSQLTTKLDELEDWCSISSNESNARCVLIKGHNGTFCSGSDLITVRSTLNETSSFELATLMQHNIRRLSRLPIITISYVEGYALGGGAELAIAADLMIMDSSAKIGFVHAKNGICCGWGGGHRLVQLLGRSRALELLSSGRLVGANEAQALGLSCHAEQGEVLKFCASHAIPSALTSGAVKSLVDNSSELPIEQALGVERQLFVSTWGKAAHLEALGKNLKHNR